MTIGEAFGDHILRPLDKADCHLPPTGLDVC